MKSTAMKLKETLSLFSLIITFSIETTVLKRIDNSCCPGDTIKYECQSLAYFNWQIQGDSLMVSIAFANPMPLISKSKLSHSVNFTVVITNISNVSITSILTFKAADPILHGITIICNGNSQDYYTDIYLAPVLILTQYFSESNYSSYHFTFDILSNECNNYSLSASPSPRVENSGQQRKYDFVSDTLYNFTLANTKCRNREYYLPTFIYDMGCPFMDEMPPGNPIVYHISTDGSMNITGRCGADEVTPYECDIDGVWNERHTCHNEKSNKSTVISQTTPTTIKPDVKNNLLVTVLLPSVIVTVSILMIILVMLLLFYSRRKSKRSELITGSRFQEVYQQLSRYSSQTSSNAQEPPQADYQQLDNSFRRTQLGAGASARPGEEYSTINHKAEYAVINKVANDQVETCLYDMVGEMETDVNEESSLAIVVQKSLPEEQNMKAAECQDTTTVEHGSTNIKVMGISL